MNMGLPIGVNGKNVLDTPASSVTIQKLFTSTGDVVNRNIRRVQSFTNDKL